MKSTRNVIKANLLQISSEIWVTSNMVWKKKCLSGFVSQLCLHQTLLNATVYVETRWNWSFYLESCLRADTAACHIWYFRMDFLLKQPLKSAKDRTIFPLHSRKLLITHNYHLRYRDSQRMYPKYHELDHVSETIHSKSK